MNRIRQFVYWAEAVGWMVLIYSLSGDSFAASRTLIALKYWVTLFHLPVSEATLELIHVVIRKTAHFSEFFVLGLLLYRAFLGGIAKFRLGVACWVSAAGAVYACAEEVHQVFTNFRTPSIRDSALNFAGILASQFWIFFRSRVSLAMACVYMPGDQPEGQL